MSNPLLNFAVNIARRRAAQEAERAAVQQAEKMAVRKAESLAVKALPAPPRRLALPAPGPKPDPRFKPRGGQWHPNTPLGETDPIKAGWSVHDRGPHAAEEYRYTVVQPDGEAFMNARSPESALQYAHRQLVQEAQNFSPEVAAEGSVRTAGFGRQAQDVRDWLTKAMTKYYKNDFGTENDPLGDLAAHGLHYDPEMTRDKWIDTANSSIGEDPIGYYTVPPHATVGGSYDEKMGPLMAQAAPWLAKQPATDSLYHIRSPLDLEEFGYGLGDLLSPEANAIPHDLAVRRDSLARMSFPQAAERVGRYNQWKAAEAERQAQAAMTNPALAVHKDYGDGMKWVQIRAPEAGLPEPPSDWGWTRKENGNYAGPDGTEFWRDPHNPYGMAADNDYWHIPGRSDAVSSLQEALKHEGDTMGHCVGGYCDEVMSGRSSIYSLRDAKGMPHVTIETAPASGWLSGETLNAWEPNAFGRFLDQRFEEGGIGDMHKWAEANFPEQMSAQNIEQIKGKQNAKPIDQYIPYVQDFVKSQPWARVEDLRNADLLYLPDRRLISHQQLGEITSGPKALELFGGDPDAARKNLAPWNLNTFSPEDWEQTKHLFEGYKRGGLIKNLAVKGDCACQHS